MALLYVFFHVVYVFLSENFVFVDTSRPGPSEKERLFIPEAMEHYDDDILWLITCFPLPSLCALKLENIYAMNAMLYDALNDDFNLINIETFSAVDDGAEAARRISFFTENSYLLGSP